MIKYYTYYSCGGYKDIYIGSDQDTADASYFIPLLNVWKKSNKPESAKKIAMAESVQHIELITKSNSAGFPSECNLMFSHGGYKAIFRTLNDGRLCLSIRDIPNGVKDEEGRDIPFNFLFLADGQESINQLDALAIKYLTNSNEINESIANAISYDPVINGVRFDLGKFSQILADCAVASKRLLHKAGNIDYIKISSRNQYKISLSEQALDENKVNSLWDDNGLFWGDIVHIEHSSEFTDKENPIDSTIYSDIEVYRMTSEQTEDDNEGLTKEQFESSVEEIEAKESPKNNPRRDDIVLESIIELHFQELEKKFSSLATLEALDNLQSLLKKLSSESNSILYNIQEKLNDKKETPNTSLIKSVDWPDELSLLNRPIIIALGCLIVGFVLGALIF